MATYGWGTNRPLAEFLFTNGYQFDFLQAVRLLEILFPDKTPVGEGSEPDKEAVRFKSRVDFNFPASEIQQLSSAKDGYPHEMMINVLSLAGNLGPLPAPYTELIMERGWHKDTAIKEFLDIFNHRLASLLYRVHRIHRIGFEFRHPDKTNFARYLFALVGLGTPGLKNRMDVNDRALLYFTGVLTQQPRSIRGLEQFLSDYFKVPVNGKQLCGRWHEIADDQTTQIGIYGQNQALGQTALIGSRVWNQDGKFELHIGPLLLSEFLDFLPIGSRYTPLCQLTRFYVGTEFEFDFILVLKSEEIYSSRLGYSQGPRLGWTAWLTSGRKEGDYCRVRLSSNYSTA